MPARSDERREQHARRQRGEKAQKAPERPRAVPLLHRVRDGKDQQNRKRTADACKAEIVAPCDPKPDTSR